MLLTLTTLPFSNTAITLPGGKVVQYDSFGDIVPNFDNLEKYTGVQMEGLSVLEKFGQVSVLGTYNWVYYGNPYTIHRVLRRNTQSGTVQRFKLPTPQQGVLGTLYAMPMGLLGQVEDLLFKELGGMAV